MVALLLPVEQGLCMPAATVVAQMVGHPISSEKRHGTARTDEVGLLVNRNISSGTHGCHQTGKEGKVAVGGWEERIETVSLLQRRALIRWARMRGMRKDEGGGKKIKGAGYEKNSGVRGVNTLTDRTYGEK